jgi:hypothetical protein
MNTKKTDIAELSDRVLQGMRKALKILVETKATKNETLVIADKNGNIKSVPAKELLPLVQKS